MKGPGRSIIYILAVLLTGCFHKAPQPPPQQVAPELSQTPPPAPDVVTAPPPTQAQESPAPAAPSATQTPVAPSSSTEEPQKPQHKKHVEKPPAEVATTPETPAVEAIGHLSAGTSGTGTQQIRDSIAETENGLRQISRTLNDQEQKTAAQIREFLKQARSALDSGDTDGAGTLATKARVLLSELSQ